MKELIFEVLPFLITIGAFILGAIKLFKKKKPLYFQILVCAAGCFALTELSDVVTVLCGSYEYLYNIGMLGVFGCNFFLLSANYGQLDRIVDDGSKVNKPSRIISLIAPVCISVFIILIFSFWKEKDMMTAVLWSIMISPALVSSYFNLKHIVMPMDDFGFLKATKLSNIAALIFYVVNAARVICAAFDIFVLSTVFDFILSLSILSIVLASIKGAKQWAT